MPQEVVEQAVPDVASVKRNAAGKITPYIAVQFGDIQEGRGHNFAGPRHDDYQLPVYIQVIAADAKDARKGYNRVIDKMLGATFPWTGNIRKRPGGGMWAMTSSNGATEAYMFPASFTLLVQYE